MATRKKMMINPLIIDGPSSIIDIVFSLYCRDKTLVSRDMPNKTFKKAVIFDESLE